MRLVAVHLCGFRRFRDRTTLEVTTDVIALVGRNEAGKSSVLDALVMLNDENEFKRNDTTKRYSGPSYIEAEYVLGEAEFKIIESVIGDEVEATKNRKWTLQKGPSGEFAWQFAPKFPEDIGYRQNVGQALLDHEADLDRLRTYTDTSDSEYERKKTAAIGTLFSERLELTVKDREKVSAFEQVFSAPQGENKKRRFQRLIDNQTESLKLLLSELSNFEEPISNRVKVGRALQQLRPKFILFEDEDRNLLSRYSLKEVAAKPPKALQNLVAVTNLDLESLRHADSQNDQEELRNLLYSPNETLGSMFHKSWFQSKDAPELNVNNGDLVISVGSGVPPWTPLGIRSDGFRWFMALRMLLAKQHSEVKPILLVDEAEAHLHYDAQADLVSVFSSQDVAETVIYTTHSAGCLPRDFGLGIRVIDNLDDELHSVIRNNLWGRNEPGFTPLVFAMGATTFSFLPARYGVLCEGVSDAMLLPTLFREATGLDDLGVQFAPGISVAGDAKALDLLGDAGHVAFLVDGDQGGKRNRKKLENAGVPEDMILDLDQTFAESGCAIEDLIQEEIYKGALQEVLGDTAHVNRLKLPTHGRVSKIRQYCRRHLNRKEPNHNDVIAKVLETKSRSIQSGQEINILDPDYCDPMKDLYELIKTTTKLPIKRPNGA